MLYKVYRDLDKYEVLPADYDLSGYSVDYNGAYYMAGHGSNPNYYNIIKSEDIVRIANSDNVSTQVSYGCAVYLRRRLLEEYIKLI